MEDPLDGPKGSTWPLQRIDRRQVYGRLLARSCSRDSNSPRPENAPVKDHTLRVVTVRWPAGKLATRANERLAIDSSSGVAVSGTVTLP